MHETRKNLLNEITDHELESLDCPTVHKQIEDLNNLMNLLDESKIKAFIESLNYEMINLKQHSESFGIVYFIFFIECREKKYPFNDKKFVLKVCNAYKSWNKSKTTNEAIITKYLKENTTIPVPDIITFSNDSDTSPLKCEFILMEYLNGKLLCDVLPKDVHELPQAIVDQFVDILGQLRELKIDEKRIGRFDENMKIVNSLSTDSIAPDNFLEYFEFQVNTAISELKKLNKYKELAEDYQKVLTRIVEIVNENKHLDRLNFKDRMTLCHQDLNPTNILIDENTFRITGIIDWEWSEYSFDDDQLDFLKTWFSNKKQKELIKIKLTSEYSRYIEKPNGKEIRRELRKLFDPIMSATFYLLSNFHHPSSKSLWSDDIDLNVRLGIDNEAIKCKENLEKMPYLLKILSEYKV